MKGGWQSSKLPLFMIYCPLCKKKFDTVTYIKKSICSECKKQIVLERSLHNQLIKNYAPSETKKSKYSKISPDKTDNEIPSCKKVKPKLSVISISEDMTSVDTKETNNETFTKLDFIPTENLELNQTQTSSDDSCGDNDFISHKIIQKDNIKIQNTKKLFPTKKYFFCFSRHFKHLLSKLFFKRREIYKQKHQEKKETDTEFHFNYDGYYNDTVSDSPATPDIIPVKEIFKVVGFFFCIILITIFIILYM